MYKPGASRSPRGSKAKEPKSAVRIRERFLRDYKYWAAD